MGQQVADNKESQMILRLVRHNTTNKLYFTNDTYGVNLIRQAYTPLNGSLIYPREWGKEKAIKHFLNHMIEDKERLIEITKKFIQELKDIKY